MKVTLYISSSEKNRLDKTSYLVGIGTLSGVLKDASSVVNPIITFEIRELMTLKVMSDDEDLVQDDQSRNVVFETVWKNFVAKTNYAYIDAFGRYYYITDIIALTNELFEIHFASDVLMSFKNQIKALPAYINRNEFEFNSLMFDAEVPSSAQETVSEYVPIEIVPGEEETDVVNTKLLTGTNELVNNVVMTNVSHASFMSYSTATGTPDIDYLPNTRTGAFNARGVSYSYVCSMDVFEAIFFRIWVDNKENYLNFIKSFVAYPFNVPLRTEGGQPQKYNVRFGDDHFTDTALQTYVVESPIGQYFVTNHFYAPTISSFKDASPSSVYEIYLPFYGWTELLIRDCESDELIVYYSVNYEDGSGVVYLYDLSKHRLLFSSPCQIGVRLSWSVSNAQELTNQKNALVLNTILSATGSMVSIVGGGLAGNPIAIGLGAVNMAKTFGNLATTGASLLPRASAKFQGGLSTLFAPIQVKIRKTTKSFINDDSAFAHQFGKPLNQVRALSSLSGFTRVGQIHLEGIPAFSGELDQIESYLFEGVYL